MPTHFTIHDLPPSERPRERLMACGAEALSTQELLAVILGRGIKGESVMVTAQRLLARFGNAAKLAEAGLHELRTIRGIGLAKAAQVKAVFELARRGQPDTAGASLIDTAASAVAILHPRLAHHKKEYFVILCLDSRRRLIQVCDISIGTLDANLVHPREVFKAALSVSAHSIILAHNHPSGCPNPSEADTALTQKLREAGTLMGISVADHLIIAREGYYSFKENYFSLS